MSNIVLEDGKYTVISDGGVLRALRNGEPWRDLTGDKLVGALCARIDELTAPGPAPKRPPVRLTISDAEHFRGMQGRYVVEVGSHSGHCCFTASVLDTDAAYACNPVCECYELVDAQKIAALLNGPLPMLNERAEQYRATQLAVAKREAEKCVDCAGTGDALAVLGDGSVEITGTCETCNGSGVIAK